MFARRAGFLEPQESIEAPSKSGGASAHREPYGVSWGSAIEVLGLENIDVDRRAVGEGGPSRSAPSALSFERL
jgi:hypothetical protein